MRDCSRLSDHMPAVALGQAQWTADQASHLVECHSCRAEWELVQAGIHLATASPGVRDTEAMARTLLQRLSQKAPHRRAGVWAAAGLATAAALAGAIWLGGRGSAGSESPQPPAVVAGLQMPLPELESLQPAELESVLQAIDDSVAEDDTSDDTGLLDLDADELQQVLDTLDTWEG